MDPTEALRLWLDAVERKDTDEALEHAEDLANWLNRGGFEPRWSAEVKRAFWAWWDASHDSTTELHAVDCDMGEDCSCGAKVEPERPVAEVLDRVIEWMIDHEPRDEEAAFDHAVLLVGLRRAADLTERAAEALDAAKDWLENHGAIYCEDSGGVDEPGLASVLAMIEVARGGQPTTRATTPLAPPPTAPGEPWAIISEDEDRADLACGCTLTRDDFGRVAWTQCPDHAAANPKAPTPGEWRCPDCGSSEIEGTAWVVLNTDKPTGDEPPTDDCWCPQCEDHPWTACCVDIATGLCTMHVESQGAACKPKHREGEQP